ncbi:MAG: peptide chain release factor 2 [Betaproteobacteria bacterium]|nr:MAG: peptide chain release factor 2 [Betaproteobacteria bacterium]
MEAERINQIAAALSDLQARSTALRRYLDYEAKQSRLAALNRDLEDPKLWENPQRAQELGREKKALEAIVGTLGRVGSGLGDAQELFQLARAEGDDATVLGVAADVEKLLQDVAALEFRRMFSNPLDANCDRKGYHAEVLEHTAGEVAGIKSATLKITGEYAYGHLRTETGVHRLVRKSPFDANARRHTSFASVFVYPEVDESIEVDINPADLRVDVYRASGAGGQHVNKTESAVRITHLPSGIVVQSQNDRSQHRNRAECMAMLKSRLYELELRKRTAAQDKLAAQKTDIEWGHQIRSYVLDQSRIKDLRTGVEKGDTQRVLDGDLDDFVEASLKQGV